MPASKEKKSFTLSKSSITFLERLRKDGKVPSTSRVLDDLIQLEKGRHQRILIENAISDYYSNLSESDIAEQKAWGEFAMEQFNPEPNK